MFSRKNGKLFSVLFAVLLVAASGVAYQGYHGDGSQPHVMSQPSQAPGNVTPNATLPTLPEQASDTAKQVINTINQAFSNTVENLGNLLSNLLGGGGQ